MQPLMQALANTWHDVILAYSKSGCRNMHAEKFLNHLYIYIYIILYILYIYLYPPEILEFNFSS